MYGAGLLGRGARGSSSKELQKGVFAVEGGFGSAGMVYPKGPGSHLVYTL